ncbi:MAG: hypothetical protein J7M24_03690 [Candidatus Latescibacteria bacterium]|nr:hypothetical protein [Candidatus Latescibacterota bacterium]
MTTAAEGRVLVTSGPTRAYFDRIRYISNTSSGALGARIVEGLVGVGMPVVHVRGPGSEAPVVERAELLESHTVETVGSLVEIVRRICGGGGIAAVVHAMAVLDYEPEKAGRGKKKSGDDIWTVSLVKTPKVTPIIRELAPKAFFVGFKLEAGVGGDELVRRAMESLRTYDLDIVVANDIDRVSGSRHEAVVLDADGTVVARTETKESLASVLVGLIRNAGTSGAYGVSR